MRIIPFYIVLIILLSCSGGDEKAPEVISFEEFAGSTNQSDSVTVGDTVVSPLAALPGLSGFVSSQLGLYDTLANLAPHPMDRFGYSTCQKLDFRATFEVPYGKSTMVTPVASLFYYTFSDTVKTNNAFYNWLDCFGKDCTPVELHKDVQDIKTPPMFTLVYDTTIVALEYRCEHQKNDWDSFEDSLINRLGKNYRYRIEVGCGGPLHWK